MRIILDLTIMRQRQESAEQKQREKSVDAKWRELEKEMPNLKAPTGKKI